MTYLEFRGTVSIESLLVDVGGESKGIEESGRGNNSKLVFVSYLDGRSAGGTLRWGESSSRAEEGSEEGELHGGELGYACELNQQTICETYICSFACLVVKILLSMYVEGGVRQKLVNGDLSTFNKTATKIFPSTSRTAA